MRRMHYTLKFNPRIIQDLKDEDDLDNVVSHSDDFANVYIVESPLGPPPTFPSSNASCDASPNTMMLSRGFASRCADSEYTPLELNRFREAILAHAVEGNEILRVYTYQVNHNHIAQDECSSKVRVSSKRGDVVVEDMFRTIQEYIPRQICKDFERDHGVQLTYNQAWHLKEKAKERLYGSPRASYVFLPWLCHRLREINPETIVEYTSHEGHFKQLFIAHAFSIQGFTMGCRLVLAIDSCHLNGSYKGALLFAIAYDADDGMFPLAMGVVVQKIMRTGIVLGEIEGILDGQEVIIISDRHQGILRSVLELFGTTLHMLGLDIDYNEAFEKLVRFNADLARWVAENSPEHWAMSKFLKKRWDKMKTNIAESFNACLREERHQTIYTLLLMHMDKLIAMLDTHMRGTDKWKSVVGPKTEEKLMSNIMRFAPITVMPYLGGTFKVFTGEEVNNLMFQTVRDSELKRRSCSHYKPVTLKCCESAFCCENFATLLYSKVFLLLTMHEPCREKELETSRWKPTLQPGEDSLVLRKYFAALLGVCEISQTPLFSCEMAPEASRSLLLTLGDIFH
ncbi:hypothetical protein CK203_105337 [Vitis vinifera]|uniref:MULE transposase domain-containing protein n=1 Tax=Vitis vinifera TaxID=29760 RepID=A0A438CXZ7_VITVI|nr:hypothetical protein CK203_105337 [Vitis vinifera]